MPVPDTGVLYFVVAYDIRSDTRRQKVLNLLKNYGVHVQFSVVECELDHARLETMRQAVLKLLNPRTDRICFYRMCRHCFFQAEQHGHELHEPLAGPRARRARAPRASHGPTI